MKDFDAGSFSDVANTPLASALWQFLHRDTSIACLETTTYLKRPAIEGLQPHLLAEFGDEIKADRVKQMTGRMVKQVMENLGYRLEQIDVSIRRKDLYKTAARYAKPEENIMNKLKWKENDLPKLGLIFLRTVLENMRGEGATVRFGNTGQGIKPNYQISFSNNRSISFSGLSHEKFNGSDSFEEKNLSESFPYSAIHKAYAGTKTSFQPEKA